MTEENDIHKQLREAGVAPGKQMTQTEELGNKIDKIIEHFVSEANGCEYQGFDFGWQKNFRKLPIRLILQACKEAGLKFMPDYKGDLIIKQSHIPLIFEEIEVE